jgi:zinc D-Ala-D-Ala carboxypeptidase
VKKKIFIASLVLIVLLAIIWSFTHPVQAPKDENNSNQKQQETAASASTFDKSKYPLDDPASLWVIVNKNHPLPKGYKPNKLVVPSVDLRLSASHEMMQVEERAAPQLGSLHKAALADGVKLVLSNGYRSEALQAQFYNDYVARDGREAADRYSARPGTSEHQTGLAVDFINKSNKCSLEECFANTKEGIWLADNAHKYGFILRYPAGKETVTGYQFEPWHYRYVGTDLSVELYSQKMTMEEYFKY